MSALVTVGEVRTAGSLGSASEPGSVTDDQITQAIEDASLRMEQIAGADIYAEVLAYNPSGTDATPELTKRQNDFKEAEARFSVSELTKKLSAAQLAKTGLLQERETGKSTTRFASLEEVKKIRREWDADAYRWLRSYLSTDLTDTDDQTIGVRTKDRKFGIAALGD